MPIEVVTDDDARDIADSVIPVADGAPMILRRARGYDPAPLRLPVPLDRPTLALGGHFKAAFAFGVGDLAFVAPHLGDLDDTTARDALEHFQRLHRVTPERVVCDADPDDATTRLAENLGLPVTPIQHHHAHFASGHADAGLTEHAIGVILDGRGGELLVGDCAGIRRVAHLRPVPQPDGAAREPWRTAVAFLHDADLELDDLIARHGKPAEQIAASCSSAPRTSSTGRLFDAVVGVLGFCDVASHEGEAAMRLEALARDDRSTVMYSIGRAAIGRAAIGRAAIERRTRARMARGSSAKLELAPSPDEGEMMLDTLPIIRGVVRDHERGVAASTIARRFHTTLVELIARSCVEIARAESMRDVVLSGGVFANLILANEVPVRLRAYGLLPHLPLRVPPNDGGLAYGQLAVIAAMDRRVS